LTTFYSPTVNPDIHAYQDNGNCSTINRDHYSDYTAYDHHNNTNPHYIIHTQVHYHHEQAHDNSRYLYRCFDSFCCSHIINNLFMHAHTAEATTPQLATRPSVHRLSKPKTRRPPHILTTPLTPIPPSQQTPTSKKPARTKKKPKTPKPKAKTSKKAKVKQQKPTPPPTTVAPQSPSSGQNSATARPRASTRKQQKLKNPPGTVI
jgi:hypothetical protein